MEFPLPHEMHPDTLENSPFGAAVQESREYAEALARRERRSRR